MNGLVSCEPSDLAVLIYRSHSRRQTETETQVETGVAGGLAGRLNSLELPFPFMEKMDTRRGPSIHLIALFSVGKK